MRLGFYAARLSAAAIVGVLVLCVGVCLLQSGSANAKTSKVPRDRSAASIDDTPVTDDPAPPRPVPVNPANPLPGPLTSNGCSGYTAGQFTYQAPWFRGMPYGSGNSCTGGFGGPPRVTGGCTGHVAGSARPGLFAGHQARVERRHNRRSGGDCVVEYPDASADCYSVVSYPQPTPPPPEATSHPTMTTVAQGPPPQLRIIGYQKDCYGRNCFSTPVWGY